MKEITENSEQAAISLIDMHLQSPNHSRSIGVSGAFGSCIEGVA